MSNDTTRHYVYDGFLLIVMYEDNSMPLVNSCIYLNQENITPNMTQILNNFNPVDVSKDVGLSIWTNDVHSFPGNYTLSYTLNSTLGSFPLGVLDEHYIGGYKKTLAGSFYYENNSLVGLVDDTPDAFIDSTDALVNIKNYISNIASNYTLTSTSPSIGGCTDGRLSYIMAYSTPCPARNDKDTLRNYNICNGSNQQLNTASVNSGNIYTWYSNDGSLATATTSSVIVTPTVSTNYIAYVDSAGCKHTEHFKVNVNPIPKTDSIQITNAICGQSLGSAIILPPNSGGNSITYNIGNGSQSSNTFNSLNPNVYSYTVTNSAGCSYIKSNSFTVVEINPAIATFYFQPVSACVNELVSFFNTSGGTTQYWWSFGTGDTTNTRNSGYTFSDTGNYVVTLIAWHNQKQCSDTAVKTIHVKECPPDSISITAPNVFTPNGDDINETWLPAIYTLGYTINYYSLIIFDRWGLKVFESSDSKNGWDGHTTSGISCSEGTYYYVIKYKASNTQGIKEQTLKGFLQLIR
jgi:gliding motility-associated-like protein